MSASIDDVAKAAKVSTATVSRALRGLPNVTQETRNTVLRVVSELGYVPSRSAAALASGRTRSVGLVVPAMSRWFFSTILDGAENALREAGFDALLYSLPDNASPRSTFDADVLRSRVDAVLVASMFFSEGEIDRLSSLNVPVVFVSVLQPGFNHVGIDDHAAAASATRHLVDLGHHVIGHISGFSSDNNPATPTARRRAGWRTCLLDAGLEASKDLDEPADMSAEGGYRSAQVLLSRRPDITAIFAASDETAIGVMRAAKERGLIVGHDLSVIGIDGHNLNEYLGLSSVVQPIHAQGVRAAELLLSLIATPVDEPQTIVFDTTLVQRSSTGPVVAGPIPPGGSKATATYEIQRR